MDKIVAILATISLLVTTVVMFSWYSFVSNTVGYLRLVENASTIEKADELLGQALVYIDKHRMIGVNSVSVIAFGDDPDALCGRIKAAKEISAKIKDSNSVLQSERDNALVKVREVVFNNSKTPGTLLANAFLLGIVIWWCVSLVCAGVEWYIIIDRLMNTDDSYFTA